MRKTAKITVIVKYVYVCDLNSMAESLKFIEASLKT